jgi:ribose transport system ATP-binding protein
VASGSLDATTDPELISLMVGRPVENLFPHRESRRDGETILEVRDISAPPALIHASFDLRRGEILAIAGLMGSGRTEMVRALFGLDAVKSGTIKVGPDSFAAQDATPSRSLFRGFGYLSEDRKAEGLALSLSVADNVTMTRFDSCSKGGWLTLARQREQTRRLIDQLRIKARDPFQETRTLSGGNQQKVSVARLLHQDADILLLDEPTRGIDIGSKAQIYDTIAQCAAQNKAVLMISSYLPELFGLADRLAVMSRGRLSEARPIADWTAESVLQAAIGAG